MIHNEDWISDDEVFVNFANELDQFTKTKQLPKSGDQDTRYYLELQSKRLAQKGVTMTYDMESNADAIRNTSKFRRWSDSVFVNRAEWHAGALTRTFYRNNKKLYSKRETKMFYEYITYLKQGSNVEEQVYSCPNCGAASKIKDLISGCPYCQTCYEMDDLYPKVTNYFMVPNENQGELFSGMRMKILLSAFVIFALVLLYGLIANLNMGAVAFAGLIAGVLFGPIFGWLLTVFKIISGVGRQAKDTTGMLFNSIGSKGRFVNKMKQYSPEFSYEYFTGKVVSLLKMLIYSDDMENVVHYEGSKQGALSPGVLDSNFIGAIAVKKFQVIGDYAELDVDAYVENMYDKVSHISRKVEKYRMHLKKNIKKPVDYHFSIKAISCQSCGGSFDATKHKTCPYCNSVYDIKDDDWFVTSVEKK